MGWLSHLLCGVTAVGGWVVLMFVGKALVGPVAWGVAHTFWKSTTDVPVLAAEVAKGRV